MDYTPGCAVQIYQLPLCRISQQVFVCLGRRVSVILFYMKCHYVLFEAVQNFFYLLFVFYEEGMFERRACAYKSFRSIRSTTTSMSEKTPTFHPQNAIFDLVPEENKRPLSEKLCVLCETFIAFSPWPSCCCFVVNDESCLNADLVRAFASYRWFCRTTSSTETSTFRHESAKSRRFRGQTTRFNSSVWRCSPFKYE